MSSCAMAICCCLPGPVCLRAGPLYCAGCNSVARDGTKPCCLSAAQMYSSTVAIALPTVVAIDHHSLKGKVVFVFVSVNIVLKARIYLWLPYRILNTESTLMTMTIVIVVLTKHWKYADNIKLNRGLLL